MNASQTDFRDSHYRLAGLIADHQRNLYIYIFSLVHRSADTDDVLQETNLALWRDAQRAENVTDFRSWAYRVAFNQVLAYRKRQTRGKILLFDEKLISRLADDLPSKVDTVTSDQADFLQLCWKKLPEPSKRLLEMRYISVFSVKNIAEQLGTTVAAISKSLYRTRLVLRKCIQNALSRDDRGQESL